MRCPSCGLRIDQPDTERCPRCGQWLDNPPRQSTRQYGGGDQPGYDYPPQSGRSRSGGYDDYPPSSGYGAASRGQYDQQDQQGSYGSYGSNAPPSGYGRPAPSSGYGQPYGQYGQAAPPGYPLGQGSGYPQQPYAPPPKKSRAGLVVGIIVAVVVVLAACSGVSIFALRSLRHAPVASTSGAPTSSAGSQSTSAPSTANATVIYQNTFASNAEGWAQDPGHCSFGSDGYHATNGYACYAPIGDQSDVIISVNVQQLSGPTTSAYGIILRRASLGNNYQFLIDSNGKWVFVKCVSNTCSKLIDFTSNAAIKGGLNTPNTLVVTAKASHFDFFVNGTKVGSTDDTTYPSGKVGVAGGDSIDCAFTNIVISRPN